MILGGFFLLLDLFLDGILDGVLDLLDQPQDMPLVEAQLFIAALAGEAGVGGLGEPLGVEAEGDLPAGEDAQGHGQQAPRVGVGDEEQRGKHHGEIPVVDAAGGTASILHEPHLEGAEEQDADHVAHAVGQADQEQDAYVNDMGEVQGGDGAVQHQPYQGHRYRTPTAGQDRGVLSRWLEITAELLLTPGAFQAGGEEAADHLGSVDQPDEEEAALQEGGEVVGGRGVKDAEGYVEVNAREEQKSAVDQLDVVEAADQGHAALGVLNLTFTYLLF